MAGTKPKNAASARKRGLAKTRGPKKVKRRLRAVRSLKTRGAATATAPDGEVEVRAIGGPDQIVFEIQWAPAGGAAELSSLIDNQLPVLGGPWVGVGRITVEYEAAAAPQHLIRWTLNFIDRTLTSLRALASKNGDRAERINEVAEKKTRWVDRGVK